MTTVKLARAALASMPLLGAALAPQWASAQSTDVIQACVGKTLGTLRLADASGACRAGETLLSWNVQGAQGPAGPSGPPGPAGPQFTLSASIRGDGTVEALTAPAGATLTVSRVAPGHYDIAVNGLGTACPLPTANAFHGPTVMWLGGGSCGGGSLGISVHAGNGVDSAFILAVSSQGPAAALAGKAPQKGSRATGSVTPLGQP